MRRTFFVFLVVVFSGIGLILSGGYISADSSSPSTNGVSTESSCIAGTQGAAGTGTCYALIYGVKTLISYCTGNETSGPCRQDHISQTAAQSLANQAETDGKAKGYDISCDVVQNSLGGGVDPNTGMGYYYDSVCTVNGLSGISASTLENGGWNVLNCDLGHAGLSTPSGTPSCSTSSNISSGVSTGLSSGGSISSISSGLSSSVASGVNVTTPEQASSVVQQAASAASQHISSSVQSILSNIGVSTNYFVNQFNDYKKSRGYGGGPTSSVSNSTTVSCSSIVSDLQLGNSGNDVLNLSKILVSEGLLSAVTSTFDQTVFNSVIAYQEKYSSAILTPLGLTSGTGFVGSATRNYMNAHAKCLSGGNTTTTSSTTNNTSTSSNGSCGASGQSCCVYPSPSACATGLSCFGATLDVMGSIMSGGVCK